MNRQDPCGLVVLQNLLLKDFLSYLKQIKTLRTKMSLGQKFKSKGLMAPKALKRTTQKQKNIKF